MTTDPTAIEIVYGKLFMELVRLTRANDTKTFKKVTHALNTFEILWPEDVKRWEARYAPELAMGTEVTHYDD